MPTAWREPAMLRADLPPRDAEPGPRRIRRLGKALALAATLLVVLGPTSAPSADGAPEGPVAQSAERLEAPGQRGGESALVSLYSTELHSTNVAEGSEVGYEMEGMIRQLPCALRDYRFVATNASVDDSQASSYEANIRIFSVNLPRWLRCGSTLPASVAASGARVEIEPEAEATVSPTRYAGGGVVVESLSDCATLDQVCPGHYFLIASFRADGRRVRLVYWFAVLATPASRRSPSTATAISQCPIR